ncbi:MAG: helix-turn-helix domain-containing protein [Nitrosopumilaceae archaeon]
MIKQKEMQKKKIILVLRGAYPLDLTQAEIARKTGMHRHTAISYLQELVNEGKLKTRKIGKYVLYRMTK